MDLLLLIIVVFIWLAFSWISAYLSQHKRRGRGPATPVPEVKKDVPRTESRSSRRPSRRESKAPREAETHPRARRQVSDAQMRWKRRPRTSRAKKRLAEKLAEHDGVATGVMMAEILGPPRAMRPHRSPVSRRRRG